MTIVAAVCVAIALLGACGSDVPTNAQETQQAARHHAVVARRQRVAARQRSARQAKIVTASDQVKAQNRARLKAAIRSQWQERAAFGLPVEGQRGVVTRSQVVQVDAVSPIDVCRGVSPRGAGKFQRQMRRALLRQRKSVLYYLNLSCPRS